MVCNEHTSKLSCTSSQIKTLHLIINFVIKLNSLRKIYQRLPFRWNAIHASNVAYLLKIRPWFLMIVVVGREEEFQSFGVRLTGFPLTLLESSWWLPSTYVRTSYPLYPTCFQSSYIPLNSSSFHSWPSLIALFPSIIPHFLTSGFHRFWNFRLV